MSVRDVVITGCKGCHETGRGARAYWAERHTDMNVYATKATTERGIYESYNCVFLGLC